MSKKNTPEESAGEPLKVPDLLAVLPLKDSVVLPYIIVPLSVGRDKSVAAVDYALSDQRVVLLLTQRDANQEEPEADGLHRVGTAATIMRMLKLPDGRTRILVQGLARVAVDHMAQSAPFFLAKVRRLEEVVLAPIPDVEAEALVRSVKEGLERVVALGRGVSPEVQTVAANLTEPGRLADLVAANIDLKIDELQSLLETLDPIDRLRRVSDALQREIQVLTMQQEISSQARGEMDKSQREYYLRQQLRAIQQELGEGEELTEEIAGYRAAIDEKGVAEEARIEIEKQIRRLERSHPDSAETGVLRTYLDWLTGLPWSRASEDDLDLKRAREILDEDHFDLDKVKERIVEFLAVRKLKSDTKGPILCFVGPPGVGKTSLGRSVARALGRKFVRISLGGVRDEAEIRGHRRTYVGALPGRIVQGIHQAGTSNPVFMLDEIDKLGADYRGDPSSALLEVLDPEQNSTFRDHYLGVPYDLSRVLFIATANLLEPIQPAFLDRMEVLRLSGYTEEEKMEIARRHVIPKQLLENGLDAANLEIADAALRHESVDDAVKALPVVKLRSHQGAEPLGMVGGECGRQLDENAPIGHVHHDQVFRIDRAPFLGPCRQARNQRESRCRQCTNLHEAPLENPCAEPTSSRKPPQIALERCFRRPERRGYDGKTESGERHSMRMKRAILLMAAAALVAGPAVAAKKKPAAPACVKGKLLTAFQMRMM